MQTYGEIGKTEAEAEKAMLNKSEEASGVWQETFQKMAQLEMSQDEAQQETAGKMAEALAQAGETAYVTAEEDALDSYKAMETAAVGSYKAVESTVVGGYKKIENAFVSAFLTKDGETTEQAKERLKAEQAERTAKQQAAQAERTAKANEQIARNKK